MQVFVPIASSFKDSIQVLDNKRCFKQVVECCDILKVLRGESSGSGWRNHPAVLSWQYNIDALQLYAYYALEEVIDRGFNVNKTFEYIMSYDINTNAYPPIWWNDNQIHKSHRYRLLQKKYEFYSQYNWNEMNDDDWEQQKYLWPTYYNQNQYMSRFFTRKSLIKKPPIRR
jgi:hypothetical protein